MSDQMVNTAMGPVPVVDALSATKTDEREIGGPASILKLPATAQIWSLGDALTGARWVRFDDMIVGDRFKQSPDESQIWRKTGPGDAAMNGLDTNAVRAEVAKTGVLDVATSFIEEHEVTASTGVIAPTAAHTGPHIVCICGSMRFSNQMKSEASRLSLEGAIVLLPVVDVAEIFKATKPCPSCAGRPGLITICTMCGHTGVLGVTDTAAMDAAKVKLDALHLRKIELADSTHIINAGGYVGESTTREIKHAHSLGKIITWLEPKQVPPWCREVLGLTTG